MHKRPLYNRVISIIKVVDYKRSNIISSGSLRYSHLNTHHPTYCGMLQYKHNHALSLKIMASHYYVKAMGCWLLAVLGGRSRWLDRRPPF